MIPAEQAATFVAVLFADLGGALDGYYATVWSAHSKATRWRPAGDLAAIASAIREADATPNAAATYLGMTLAPRAGPSGQRLRNGEVGALVCVWADIDLASPAHTKPGLPPTETDGLRILRAPGLAPTMIWHTGHGLQACWGLTEPHLFTPSGIDPSHLDAANTPAGDAARLLRDWNTTLAVHAHRLGRYPVDRVHDLSRVLRPPGTLNRKISGDHRPVELIEVNEAARYELSDFAEHLVDRRYLDQFSGMTARSDGGGTAAVDLKAVWLLVNSAEYRAAQYEPGWLTEIVTEGVLSEDDTLIRVFRKGHSSGDASSRDAALARCLADVRDGAGKRVYDERDAVELIMCARLREGDKLEKVDPAARGGYYLGRTIDRVWAQSETDYAQRAAAMAAGAAAVTAQDVIAQGLAVPALPAVTRDDGAPLPARGPAGRASDMGAEIVADLDRHADVVVADRDAPANLGEDADPETPPPAPGPTDPPTFTAGPGWGVRTEVQKRELTALSLSLLGPSARDVQVWRVQTRSKGVGAQRRIGIRVSLDYRWPGYPPEGYTPGTVLWSGWWPAATFNSVGGWIRALEQDLMVVCERVTAKEFAARFGQSLIRVWEPDSSGGSLMTTTRRALESYLLDYPPTPEWLESLAQGCPYITQRNPRWRLESPFSVLVRWPSFARHVRNQFSINVTPAVAAEMAELSGSALVTTGSQNGQWRQVRRDYLGDAAWLAVLHGGRAARDRRQGEYLRAVDDSDDEFDSGRRASR